MSGADFGGVGNSGDFGNTAAMQAQSPMVLTTIQNQFIHHFVHGFAVIGAYASDLFYILAGLEIALFGLIWAIRQEGALGSFVLKILKLGVLFFLITQFPMLLQALIDGFTKAGYGIAGTDGSLDLFNPAHLWNYGFDASMNLMKLSMQAVGTNMALSNIYLFLGGGILFLFALIGAQIILVVTAFYIVSLLALLLLPLGVFFASKNFFERAIESVFRAGARVFALVIVLGIGESIWSQFDLSALSTAAANLSGQLGSAVGSTMGSNMTAGMNPTAGASLGSAAGPGSMTLMAPLGFIVATLVILVLCLKLPGLVAETVGKIGGKFSDELESGPAGSASAGASVNVSMPSATAQVAAGANMQGPGINTSGAGASYGAQGVSAASSMQGGGGGGAGSVSVSANVTGGGGGSAGAAGGSGSGLLGGGGDKSRAKEGSDVGMSRETLNKLKSTFKQAMKESKFN